MTTQWTQPSKPLASSLTMEELALLKGSTAKAISDSLNRISAQTGLRIQSVNLDVRL